MHKLLNEENKTNIQIVEYTSKYNSAFKNLNKEWISAYFKMEEADYKALDNADSYIIENGGCILIALFNNEPVGVCALIKMNDNEYDYELAKMAVSPKVQGKRIGLTLGEAIIEKAKSLGALKIYLESNTILVPAINLYIKLGFKEVFGRPSPYERVNIQMELVF
jgi:GNAT superfamily N-acetyltransferase